MTLVDNLSIPSASSSRYEAICVDVDLSGIFNEGTTHLFFNTYFDYLQTIGSTVARMASVEVMEKAFFNDNKKILSI